MDLVIDMAKKLQESQPELTLDECINIAADACYQDGVWSDFDETTEGEAYEY